MNLIADTDGYRQNRLFVPAAFGSIAFALHAPALGLLHRISTGAFALLFVAFSLCGCDLIENDENPPNSDTFPANLRVEPPVLYLAPGETRSATIRLTAPPEIGASLFGLDATPPLGANEYPITDDDLAIQIVHSDQPHVQVSAAASATAGIHRVLITSTIISDIGDIDRELELRVVTLPGAAQPLAGRVADVAAGDFHSLALLDDGSVRAWGRNDSGQLGDGTYIDRQLAVPVIGLPGPAIAIAAGGSHSLALMADGTIYAWGSNSDEQVQFISTLEDTKDYLLPTQLRTLHNGIEGPVDEVIAIAAGNRHSAALRANGEVLVWGGNTQGQLGNPFAGPTVHAHAVTILTGASAIASGDDYLLAWANDGTAWGWGSNNLGQIAPGFGSIIDAPLDIGFVSDVVGVAAGAEHTLLLLADGNLGGLGNNSSGQLGDGSLNSPIAQPTRPPRLLNVIAADGGFLHSLALQADKSVYAWGDDSFGQVSDSAMPTPDSFGRLLQRVPERVVGLPPSSGIAAGGRHSLSVDETCGKVWAFGDNNVGQLGDGAVNDFDNSRARPMPAYGLGDLGVLDGCRTTLSLVGTGGTVSASPDGAVALADADCSTGCATDYAVGTRVTLTATPAADAEFLGWGGNCSGSSAVIEVVMDRSRSCLARFNRAPVAHIRLTPDPAVDGAFVDIDGVGSSDPDGAIVRFEWDLDDDGAFDDSNYASNSALVFHDETTTVHLRVTDDRGATAVTTRTFTPLGVDARITYTPASPGVGQSVTFDASTSSSTLGPITAYAWDLDEDQIYESSGVTVNHVFTTAGIHFVNLRVTDSTGASDIDRARVTVIDEVIPPGSNAPTAAFSFMPTPAVVDQPVNFDAAASSDDIGIVNYAWDFDDDGVFDASGQLTSFTYTSIGSFTARLRVTDADGQSDETTLPVTVVAASNGNPVLTVVGNGGGAGQVFSVPAGLNCGVNGMTTTPDPCSIAAATGSTIQIVAVPDPGAVFSHWGAGDCDLETTNDALPACDVTLTGDRTVRVSFE